MYCNRRRMTIADVLTFDCNDACASFQFYTFIDYRWYDTLKLHTKKYI